MQPHRKSRPVRAALRFRNFAPRSVTALLLIAGLTGLHALWLHGIAYNSDEGQHLHVAWSWTQGLLPYRDVIDNHGPLFGLINAPLLALLGERASIVYPMRLAMLPWFVVSLISVYVLARRLYEHHAALAACALTALYPTFLLVTAQVRTDCMWIALWLATVAVLFSSRPTARRWFAAGVLTGLAFCVSQKTVLLLACCIGAACALMLMTRRRSADLSCRCTLAALAGLLLPSACFFVAFAMLGILGSAWYGLVLHNLLPLPDRPYALVRHLLYWPLLAIATLLAAKIARAASPFAPARGMLFLTSAIYALTLYAWWPLITRQDQLPFIAGFGVVFCGEWLRRVKPIWLNRTAIAAAAVVFLALLAQGSPPSSDALAHQRSERALVLQLTAPSEPVMDAKGETVFRHRPFFYALESVTRQGLKDGRIPDTIAAGLKRTGTHVVVACDLPPKDAAFVKANYLPVGNEVYVAGLRLYPDQDTRTIRVEIAGDYRLLSREGPLRASVDGGATADEWRLSAGSHSMRTDKSGGALLVWAPALRRGLNAAELWANATGTMGAH